MAKKVEIEIPAHVIKTVAKKQGVYSNLAKPVNTVRPPVTVTDIIKIAFLEYARKHNCPKEQEELEWTRFSTILAKYL